MNPMKFAIKVSCSPVSNLLMYLFHHNGNSFSEALVKITLLLEHRFTFKCVWETLKAHTK